MSVKVQLPPSAMSDVNGSISKVLKRRLMKYDDSLGGVMLAFSNVVLRRQYGTVFNELPNIMFDVDAEMVLFSPQSGADLVGTINKIGRNHIGLLVGGVFNASISADKMHTSLFSYDADLDSWSGGTGGENGQGLSLNVGNAVAFTVERIQAAGGIFCIAGQEPRMAGAPAAGGFVMGGIGGHSAGDSGDSGDAEGASAKKKKKDKKKKKKRKGDDVEGGEAGSDGQAAAASAAVAAGEEEEAQRKKADKKKRRRSDASGAGSEKAGGVKVEGEKKKVSSAKKKDKKDKAGGKGKSKRAKT
jgi:DNA-directed RNA polymerase I subunit RPA43